MESQKLNHGIEHLKMLVGKTFGLTPSAPTDFARLSEAIAASGAGYVSPSTLKRMWGYVKDSGSRHLSTLDIPARYVGFADFAALCRSLADETSAESGFPSGGTLNVDSLALATEVEVSWLPDRMMTLRYLGDMTFEILSAVNTRLTSGDRVRCMQFVTGHPLMLDIVGRDGDSSSPKVYVVGKTKGIRWAILS